MGVFFDELERRCTERIELSANGDVVALNVPAGQWHTVKALESGLEEVPGQARDEGPRTGRMNPSVRRMCWSCRRVETFLSYSCSVIFFLISILRGSA